MLSVTESTCFALALKLPSVRTGILTTEKTLIGLLLPAYLMVSLVIGWAARRHFQGANSFLNASRSLPIGIVVLACVAANCGAFEVIGMSSVAAQYGIVASHFYLMGAIPAILYSALELMPIYRALSIRSVPQFLEIRYGRKMRLLNACVVACTLLLLGGISLFAVSQFLEVIVGWSFHTGAILSAVVVLVYILLGGIRATIYNEVLQLSVVLLGLLPVGIFSVRFLVHESRTTHVPVGHLWIGLPLVSVSSPFDVFGIALGLGLVLSFSYWCTDFVLMQRAFTARTEQAAQQVPLWTGLAKLFFALLVVCPGLVAARLFSQLGVGARYEQALPLLMQRTYGPLMFGLGCTALAASLLSGVGANAAAFASVWTEDIYRAYLRPARSEPHYLAVGRCAVIFAIVVAVLDSSITFHFSNMMEHVQLVLTIFGTPFWAIFLLGILSLRITTSGALAGFVTGLCVSVAHLILSASRLLPYTTSMSASFHSAVYSFTATCIVAIAISILQRPAREPAADRLVLTGIRARSAVHHSTWFLVATLLILLIVIDWVLR